jgi:hypothetical protein
MKETGRFKMNRYRSLSTCGALLFLTGCEGVSLLYSMDNTYSGYLSDAEIGSQVKLVDDASWLALTLVTNAEGEPSGELFFDGSITVYGQAIFDYSGQAYEIENLHLDEKQFHGRIQSPDGPPLKLRGEFEPATDTLVLNARGIGKLYLIEGAPFEAHTDEALLE